MFAIDLTTADLLVLDFESTGKDPRTALAVEVAAVNIEADGATSSRVIVINPGVEIPDEAAAVHGITTAHAITDGVAPHGALVDIVDILGRHVGPIVAFNARYDLTLLTAECERHGIEAPPFDLVIDPLLIDKVLDKWRSGSRKLIDMAAHYGVAFDEADAHGAEADCIATAGVLRAIAAKYGDQLPSDAKALMVWQADAYDIQRTEFIDYVRTKGMKGKSPDPTFWEPPGWPVIDTTPPPVTVAVDWTPGAPLPAELRPINQANEAHERGYYIDPTDPAERRLQGVTTIKGKAFPPYLTDWAANQAAEYALDNHERIGQLLAEGKREQVYDVIRKQHDRTRDTAANRGTIVHTALELFIKGQSIDVLDPAFFDDDTKGLIRAGLAFLVEHQVEVIWSEATVFNPDAGYAGTGDLWSVIRGIDMPPEFRIGDGDNYLGDFKTGKKTYADIAYQFVGYASCTHAVSETGQRLALPKVDGYLAIHLKADGSYDLRPVRVGPGEIDAWEAGVVIARERASVAGMVGRVIPRPKIAEVPKASVPDGGTTPSAVDVSEGDETSDTSAPLSGEEAVPTSPPAASSPGFDDVKAWVAGRLEVIRDATVEPSRLGPHDSALAMLLASWPAGVPAWAEITTIEQLDALSAVLTTIETTCGLPFGDTDPRIDAASAPVDRARLDELALRIGKLPADLIPDEIALTRSTEARYGADVQRVGEAEHAATERAAHVVALLREILAAVDPDGALDAGTIAGNVALLCSLERTDKARLLTQADVDRLDLICEAATTGFVQLGKLGEVGSYRLESMYADDLEDALVDLFGNKRDALNKTKRAAKHHDVPAPAKFDDISTSPLLVALAISAVDDEHTSAAAAA